MNYEEALIWLHGMKRTHKKPTLDRMRLLLSLLGNPEKTLAGRFLHVTGTNGKGSSCAFLTAALRAGGYTVGRFISPFIMEFRERMEIDGSCISEEKTALLCTRLRTAAERMTALCGETPLEFELVTVLGLLWFAERRCDFVVLEVGIGGTFDPTAVVTPLLSVIMCIDRDHTELLGETTAEIAAQKCGILKPNAPCVLYPENPADAVSVIKENCKSLHIPLHTPHLSDARLLSAVPGKLCFSYGEEAYTLRLSGVYQMKNALTALTALRLLPSLGYPLSCEAIHKGLSEASFPARFELLSEEKTVILDGAHNRSGMCALRENLDYYFGDKPVLCLCGMLRDKNPAEALAPVLSRGNIVFAATVTPPTPRAMDADTLSALYRENGIPSGGYPSVASAMDALFEKQAETGCPIVCFGSLYMAGDVRRYFGHETED